MFLKSIRLMAAALFNKSIRLGVATLMVSATALQAQTVSIPADLVQAPIDPSFVDNAFCSDDVSRASDGVIARNRGICPDATLGADYTFALTFSPNRPQFLTGMRVWANAGNFYGDAELRQFDLQIDYFDPTTGLVATQNHFNQTIGDTLNDNDPKTVSFGALYQVSEVRVLNLRGVPSGTNGRTEFREIQGVFEVLPIAPEISVTSSTAGPIADGGTDPQGTQQAGVSQTITYTVRNEGTDTMLLSGTPTVSAAFNIAGALSVGTPASTTLEPGQTTTFDVTFTPEVDGAFSFDLSIPNDDADEAPFAVNVSGSSNAAPIVVLEGPSGPQSGPFYATVRFSEPVTGFDLSDLIVTNGVATQLSSDAAGQIYTVLITPAAPGQGVTISVPAAAAVDADGATSAASNDLFVGSGVLTPEALAEIERLIVEDTMRTTRLRLETNQRAMRSARERFAGARMCQRMTDQITEDDSAPEGCRSPYQNVPLRFDGTMQATQDASHVIGSFFGQTYGDTGTRRLILGDFDVTRFDDGDVIASLDGRIAWERLLSDTTMLGYFVGASVSNSKLNGSFTGDRKGYGLFAGAYFVDEIDENLYWDGFVSAGVGQNDLTLNDGVFDVTSAYLTKSLQLGVAVSGDRRFDRFVLRPALSLAYGYTQIGDVDLDVVTANSTQSDVAQAGDVTVGIVRFTPEMRVPIEVDSAAYDAAELRIAPSLLCEAVRTLQTSRDCGGGLEFEWSSFSQDRMQEFSARISRQMVGSSAQNSFGLEVQHRF